MKKICLIIILSLIMCLLVSCNNYPIEINSHTILYNGHKYILQDSTSDFWRYYYYYNPAFRDTPSQRIAITPFLGTISIAWSEDFDDNILQYRTPGCGLSYYFKEGFQFPKHNEAALSKILLSEGGYEPIIEIPDETKVTWSDIIDYSISIPFDSFQGDIFCCYGLLRGYSASIYTGEFWVILFQDVVYIGGERDIRRGDNKVYYKISDEYQQIFKDVINEYYK